MKRLWILLTLLMCSLPVQAIVTYQGQLVHDGQPYTGTAEIRFSLWDSALGGNELANHTFSVQVVDGLFQEEVPFPIVNYYGGAGRWIEAEVLQPGPATTLAPRQRIRDVPRAYTAHRATGGLFTESILFRVEGPGGDVFRAGRVGGQVRVGIGSGTPNAHLSIGSNLDFWSMGGSFTADRPTIRGTTAGNLSISGSGEGAVHINSDGGSGGIRFYDGSGGSSGEMMRITGDSFGDSRVGIGVTDPLAALHIGGKWGNLRVEGATWLLTSLQLPNPGTSSGSALCRTNDSFGSVVICSSIRELKYDILPLARAGELLAGLRPVRFNWKEDGRADLGLIAEEVAEVIPELATRNNQGDLTGVNYRHLTAVLIGALQEQQTESATQQSEIVALRTEYQEAVAALNAEVTELRTLADRAADAEARLAALEALLLDGSEVANAAR